MLAHGPRRADRFPRVVAAVLTVVFGAAVLVAAVRPGAASTRPQLRLGYFPNITHAPAIVGVDRGLFDDALGPQVRLKPAVFAAGPSAIEALLSGALDAVYTGPNPAINAYVRSGGRAVRIVAGSTAGGAFLVVKPSIRDVSALAGKRLASPQIGGTQDVALRHWLASKGFRTTLEGGGDVSVIPQATAQTLETFRAGTIDGAWLPEPWATRLVHDGGAHRLIDERTLWSGSHFTSTVLLVRTAYLERHPDIVERLLRGHEAALAFLHADPSKAQTVVNEGIEKLTNKKLAPEVMAEAWKSLTFTDDPGLQTVATSARHAVEVGLLDKAAIDGIADLRLLDVVRAEAHAEARAG